MTRTRPNLQWQCQWLWSYQMYVHICTDKRSFRNIPEHSRPENVLFNHGYFFSFLAEPTRELFFDTFFPNTRAKILSTFFSWRCRLKACSI